MTSFSALASSRIDSLLRFLRTPKGLLIVIFSGLLGISFAKLGNEVVASKIVVAGVTAAALDIGLSYWRRREWVLPDGAVLTGMIVAFVLRPQESLLVVVAAVGVAILSKHALRTHWSNIFNPAAVALVFAAIVLNAGQSWWGALPDLGIIGALIVLVAGGFIADRMNKLPMILAFGGVYFTLLTVASFLDSSAVAETFRTPDLQAVLFFAFFMLDDPPTSPVRHEDQIVFGVIVATVAYFVYKQFGGIYYLPAGLLVGNLWESCRRLVLSRVRLGVLTLTVIGRRLQYQVADNKTIRTLRVASGVATAVVTVVLLVVATVASSGNASDAVGSDLASGPPTTVPSAQPPTPVASARPAAPVPSAEPPAAPYPILTTFNADVSGIYSQTSSGGATDLTVDAVTSGDLVLKMHLELSSTAGAASSQATINVNKAQLLDPSSNTILCDGQFSAFNSNLVRATCVGRGPYQGVQITFSPTMQSDSATTLSGTMTGSMQRTQ